MARGISVPVRAFLRIPLAATRPLILTGMRLTLGNSFPPVGGPGMLAADPGLGYVIFNSRL